MNKALIEVYVPCLEQRYDVFIPINKSIDSVTMLLSKAINELSDGSFPIRDSTLLYNKIDGNVYDGEKTVLESGIKNSSQVILY